MLSKMYDFRFNQIIKSLKILGYYYFFSFFIPYYRKRFGFSNLVRHII